MSEISLSALEEALAQPAGVRLERLTAFADELAQSADAGQEADPAVVDATVKALLEVVSSGEGSPKLRLGIGEALGRLGDPRLSAPGEAGYWVTADTDLGPVQVGRFPVTIAEWQRFVAEGGYEDDSLWDEDGKAWRDGVHRLWPELASRDSVKHLVVANQPVVGISWHEAMAYARKHGARLLGFNERMQVARGAAKRPYPWGEPFGRGNSNTREEVLGKPCAVGLFVRDQTPEGIADLAGNVAEWTADRVGDERVVHPGSWEQTSMASWAKARALEEAGARLAALGFRLARDVDE
ncbi:MAG: SUMF1/EgtB/PvdO family nonheme iron enzyme [Myxococcota bacterium]|nr:SUMF1/EgtB/PvdO family nonheme iron enzyme [Myxococcota bacterium]